MSNLGNQASQCSLDKVYFSLPDKIRKKILKNISLSTYVWVVNTKEDANKIVEILEKNGFFNISLDSLGTTITAQSQSAGNDGDEGGSSSRCNAKLATKNNCETNFNVN